MTQNIQLETEMELELATFYRNFVAHYQKVALNFESISELEREVDVFSRYILNENNTTRFHDWQQTQAHPPSIVPALADITAKCVKLMEVLRAKRHILGEATETTYFQNIEHCIQEEFGQFTITANDTVLLVGSGAFPMTPIQIAKETGAKVIGIDIDAEAIEYGRQIVADLAPQASIELYQATVDQLPQIQEVTHVIFSSTVPLKYDILAQLYALTGPETVVAMRYGNDLKSIFNYPKRETNAHQWVCVDEVIQPNQIFDIALYQKADVVKGVGA
ncbi:staphylopine biosynthesis enzyme CntL [Staphylococcus chromogenes]|uniref:Staphylopine biosynthesis enzyme CntL n=1 Tax=Staphylococcus chromogenes TaxID=46126 RepID=A0AAE5SY73_STACR|nr:staphylopine biosynthesis enzyme CntL [Staphylococcus chromogenes]PTF55047.1 staphylopine biosynthesis enzyme CntL [Staphylococcus chromogenes]PTF59207.1 staphylopine biosynthesis enzyme CntL [Staphylococcus chromogenes]PTF80044.1 staphylopine biosynthesis enzyme CntL [Staphylococcus chromogenes]PTF86605.1 staphylopine biosynthesis enzyme CntL [Staphylococcus chromogenes]PTF90687.1 staphylopine biosynthesis enzyme CntL [Staphylococcus chromogenes]